MPSDHCAALLRAGECELPPLDFLDNDSTYEAWEEITTADGTHLGC